MINPITPNIMHLFNNTPIKLDDRLTGSESSFTDILNESLKTAGEADHKDKGSTMQLLMGEADDLSGLLIDAQKAELALQLALQIRNKVIDAYNEVMRMSV